MRFNLLKVGLAACIITMSCLANAGIITSSQTFNEYGGRNTDQNDFSWLFSDLSPEIDKINLKFSWEGMDFTDNEKYKDEPREYLDIYAGSTKIGLIGDFADMTYCVEAHPGTTNSWESDCSGSKEFLLDDSELWSTSALNLWAHNVNEGSFLGVQSNGVFTDLYPQGFITASISYEAVAESSAKAVSEPSTLAIFALGMVGLVSRRFKKKL